MIKEKKESEVREKILYVPITKAMWKSLNKISLEKETSVASLTREIISKELSKRKNTID